MKGKLLVIAFLLMATAAAAPKEKLVFEVVEFPGASTAVRGINNAGEISGSYGASSGFQKGFIRLVDGTFKTLEVPGAFITVAWGIDDSSRVVGWFFDELDPFALPAGFLYQNGQYTRLDYPGSQGTQAYGVSAAGVVGGFYSGGHYHGFLWKDGAWTQLDVPVSTDTFAFGISPGGQVVGIWDDGGDKGRRGFIYTSGAYTVLDFPRPGTYATELYAINGTGSILGAVSNGGCDFQPFIFNRLGRYTLIDLPGSFITGINDSGLVVGIFGNSKGFVAKASAFAIK